MKERDEEGIRSTQGADQSDGDRWHRAKLNLRAGRSDMTGCLAVALKNGKSGKMNNHGE
jgi:hypothetical protein